MSFHLARVVDNVIAILAIAPYQEVGKQYIGVIPAIYSDYDVYTIGGDREVVYLVVNVGTIDLMWW